MSNTMVTKRISDYKDSNEMINIVVIKVNYNNWKPEIKDVSNYKTTVPAAMVIISDIKSMKAPYDYCKFNGDLIRITKANGSLGLNYAWAKSETETPGTFSECRIYMADDSGQPIITSRKNDEFDTFIIENFNKAV